MEKEDDERHATGLPKRGADEGTEKMSEMSIEQALGQMKYAIEREYRKDVSA